MMAQLEIHFSGLARLYNLQCHLTSAPTSLFEFLLSQKLILTLCGHNNSDRYNLPTHHYTGKETQTKDAQ